MVEPLAGSAAPQCPASIIAFENREPWAYYEELRTTGPVHWDAGLNAWLVLDFDACKAIEQREDLYRHPYADAGPLLVEIKGGPSNITLLQGEAHQRMRRLYMKLLSPANLATYRDRHVQPIIHMLIDRILAKGTGRADLTSEFGDQIPPRVILSLLGLDWRDDDLVHRTLELHEDIVAWIGRRNSGEELTRVAKAAADAINAILLPIIRERRERPVADFISRIWTDGPAEFGPITEADALAICREFYLGGADTTVHGIANELHLLLTNATVRAEVERDRKKVPHVVEESMRLYGSVQYRFRVANLDGVIAGVAVKKDQALVLLHAAANRDPAHYGCPADVDLSRLPAADHLAFNTGPRTCPGAGLARAELRGALEAILDWLPGARLDPDAPPPRFANLYIRSYRPLHVVF